MKSKIFIFLFLFTGMLCARHVKAQEITGVVQTSEHFFWSNDRNLWYDYDGDGRLDVLMSYIEAKDEGSGRPDDYPEAILVDGEWWNKSETATVLIDAALWWGEDYKSLPLFENLEPYYADLPEEERPYDWEDYYELIPEMLTEEASPCGNPYETSRPCLYQHYMFVDGEWYYYLFDDYPGAWSDWYYRWNFGFVNEDGQAVCTPLYSDEWVHQGNGSLNPGNSPFYNTGIYRITDYNRDGYADLFFYGKEKGSEGEILINDASGNFSHFADLPVIRYSNSNNDVSEMLEVDVNIDGRMDYYYMGMDRRHHLLVSQSDGTLMDCLMEIVTDAEVMDNAILGQNTSYGNKFVKPSINMSGFSMPDGDYGVTRAYENISTAIDINGDGYPDFVDNEEGGAFLSLGNGAYYPAVFNGKIYSKDLNGDLIPDFVILDTESGNITLKLSDGTEYITKDLMNNRYLSGVYCYDFDRDGDVDILLTMDNPGYRESYTDGYSFLVWFRNDGNNKFTQKERGFENRYKFLECADINNDGHYAMVASEYMSEEYEYYLVIMTWDESYDVSVVLREKYNCKVNTYSWPPVNEYFLYDYDHDGKTELYIGDYAGNDKTVLFGEVSANVNTRPEQMQAPTCVLDSENGFLRIEWQLGSDKETSVPDLSYALRIGTAPGKGDVLHAYANADGTRTRPGDGNAGFLTYKMMNVNNWQSGKYYIAVQAVDANGLASPWSEEAIYEHTFTGAMFSKSMAVMNTGDTLDVRISGVYNPDFTYTYSVSGDGRVIEQHDGYGRIVFGSNGVKTVTLTVSDGTDEYSTSQDVTVYAVSFTNEVEKSYIERFFDLDMDGQPEGLYDGIYTSDGDGTFTRLMRSYNVNISSMHSITVMDYNMDGLPDLYGLLGVQSGGPYNMMINNGDLDFSMQNVSFMIDGNDYERSSIEAMADLDGDGLLDLINMITGNSYRGFYRNMGDNNYELYPIVPVDGPANLDMLYVADINRDGLKDYWAKKGEDLVLGINQGNFQWEEKVISDMQGQTIVHYIGVLDVNGDGFFDLVLVEGRYGRQGTRIFWGDASYDYERFDLLETNLWTTGVDINNDGRIELIDEGKNLYSWMSDGVWWIEPYDGNDNPHWADGYMGLRFLDLNGDGVPDGNMSVASSNITNEPPTVPTGLYALVTEDGVILRWNASTDKENPSHALRYNVSLKKKGAEGDGAYILSPLNGTSDEAMPLESCFIVGGGYSSIGTNSSFYTSTQTTVPLSRFEAGEEYELCVQAIDTWNAFSPFSERYTFTVDAVGNISMPSETGVNRPVTVRFTGTDSGTPQFDWGGGTAEQSGDGYSVVWDTEGLKTVTCTVGNNVYTNNIYVYSAPQIEFDVPEKVLAGSSVTIALPELFADPSNNVSFQTYSYGQSDVQLYYPVGKCEVVVTFPETDGKYQLSVRCQDRIFGDVTFSRDVEAVGQDFRPEISLVSRDASTGKNRITWDAAQQLPDDAMFTGKVRIYKEMNTTDNFVLLAEVDRSAGEYVDLLSQPDVRKSRYRIAYPTVYGDEAMSLVHSSIHLMINKGLNGSLNLMWNAYEGGVMDSYTVMRGTDADNLAPVAVLSGYEQSYTDTEVPDGVCYYALSYDRLYTGETSRMPARAASDADVAGVTNVVCSSDASEVNFMTSLEIYSRESELVLNDEQRTLHLYTVVRPLSATFGEVQWHVSEGADIVSVSSDGTVTLLPQDGPYGGKVTVQATAKDGSGVTASVDIEVTTTGIFTSVEDMTEIYYDGAGDVLCVRGVSERTLLRIYDVSGMLRASVPVSFDCMIPMGKYSSGLYIVRMGNRSVKILKQK